jgi:hypothetical protein
MRAGKSIRRFTFRLIRIENGARTSVEIAKLPVMRCPDESKHRGDRDADESQEDQRSGGHRSFSCISKRSLHQGQFHPWNKCRSGWSRDGIAPLGRAVIGGLLMATVATLFFVPVVFSLLHRRAPVPAPEPGAKTESLPPHA